MSALSASKILIKGSDIPGRIPTLSSLDYRELAINFADGVIYAKTVGDKVVAFRDNSQSPFIFNSSLSAILPQYGNNNVTSDFGVILNGVNNIVSGAGSVIVNGESNKVESDLSFIGSGADNVISLTADFGAILGGSSNNLDHTNSFIVGSNITSHAENFTYVNNLSVVGKIYGDGSNLTGITDNGSGSGDVSVNTLVRSSSASWDIIGDRYFTTSSSTNSINKGTKIFIVSTNLSYIPTQDVTIVHDHDIGHHMHGTVLDYNSTTGSLTADITSHTGSGTYSIWRINIGGTPTFTDSLVASNNLSDVANSSIALTNLQGVSKSEIQSLSGTWQQAYTLIQSNSAAWSSPLPKRYDFIDQNEYSVSYAGVAPYGSLESSSVWTVTKTIYTTVGSISSTQYANNVAWVNRLTVSYS